MTTDTDLVAVSQRRGPPDPAAADVDTVGRTQIADDKAASGVDDDRMVHIDMTLTTPNCPSAAELPAQVENAVAGVAGVREAKVNIVWDPPWDPSRMSDEARTTLNMW